MAVWLVTVIMLGGIYPRLMLLFQGRKAEYAYRSLRSGVIAIATAVLYHAMVGSEMSNSEGINAVHYAGALLGIYGALLLRALWVKVTIEENRTLIFKNHARQNIRWEIHAYKALFIVALASTIAFSAERLVTTMKAIAQLIRCAFCPL